MNFLAHLALSGNRAEIMVGNLMGDFVKGRLDGRFPAGIQFGLELHRRIDRFAEDSEHFIRSRHRIDGRFGLFRGALVDLFYDHFLARNWRLYTRNLCCSLSIQATGLFAGSAKFFLKAWDSGCLSCSAAGFPLTGRWMA